MALAERLDQSSHFHLFRPQLWILLQLFQALDLIFLGENLSGDLPPSLRASVVVLLRQEVFEIFGSCIWFERL